MIKEQRFGSKRVIRFISRSSCRSENCQSAAQADGTKIKLENGIGSLVAFIAAAVGREMKGLQLFVLNDKEEAAYFYNDFVDFL